LDAVDEKPTYQQLACPVGRTGTNSGIFVGSFRYGNTNKGRDPKGGGQFGSLPV
jgi:hypothetical protein